MNRETVKENNSYCQGDFPPAVIRNRFTYSNTETTTCCTNATIFRAEALSVLIDIDWNIKIDIKTMGAILA